MSSMLRSLMSISRSPGIAHVVAGSVRRCSLYVVIHAAFAACAPRKQTKRIRPTIPVAVFRVSRGEGTIYRSRQIIPILSMLTPVAPRRPVAYLLGLAGDVRTCANVARWVRYPLAYSLARIVCPPSVRNRMVPCVPTCPVGCRIARRWVCACPARAFFCADITKRPCPCVGPRVARDPTTCANVVRRCWRVLTRRQRRDA